MPGAYDAGMMQYEVREPSGLVGREGKDGRDLRTAAYGQTSRYAKEEESELVYELFE